MSAANPHAMMTPRERYHRLYPLFDGELHLDADETIIGRAPMRWMLSGWRDVPRGGGGDCTNVALTAGAFAALRRGQDPERLRLFAPDIGMDLILSADDVAREPDPGEPHAVLRALLYAAQVPMGLELTASAKGIPAAAGLGTSAALQVSILATLAEAAGRTLAPLDQVYAARLPETYLLGLSCGFQDQAAAVHGGLANYHCQFGEGTEELEIRELAIAPGLIDSLEAGLIVVDFGQPHSSHAAHLDVFERLESGHPNSVRAFALLGEAEAGVQAALAAGDFDAFAAAVSLTWEAQKLLHPAMILPVMYDLVEMVQGLGVRSANVNGAGMGGTVTLLAEPGAAGRVVRALNRVGGVRVLPCGIDREGVRCWRHRSSRPRG